MLHFRLNYQTGNFILVFPVAIRESRKLSAYLLDLKNSIAGLHIYPEKMDDYLFPRFRYHYLKIAHFFEFDPDQLTQESRHHFFIATEPITYREQLIPGLSLLEQLLGYKYPEDGTDSKLLPQELITTGDLALDIIADAILIFKVGGLENHYSLDDLAKLCKQANDRLKQAEELAKGETIGGDENLENEPLDDDFVKDRSRLYNWLINFGVSVPMEF